MLPQVARHVKRKTLLALTLTDIATDNNHLCDKCVKKAGRAGSGQLHNGSGPEKSDPWSTLGHSLRFSLSSEVGAHCGYEVWGVHKLPSGSGWSAFVNHILVHFRHKFAPFDCLMTNKFLCLLSIKTKLAWYVRHCPGQKKDLQHKIWQPLLGVSCKFFFGGESPESLPGLSSTTLFLSCHVFLSG